MAELDGAGNVVARFVYGTKGNVPDYMEKGGVTHRILSDHLGSARLVVDASMGVLVVTSFPALYAPLALDRPGLLLLRHRGDGHREPPGHRDRPDPMADVFGYRRDDGRWS